MLAKKASLIGRYLFFLTCLYSCNWFTVALEVSREGETFQDGNLEKLSMKKDKTLKNQIVEEESLIEKKPIALNENEEEEDERISSDTESGESDLEETVAIKPKTAEDFISEKKVLFDILYERCCKAEKPIKEKGSLLSKDFKNFEDFRGRYENFPIKSIEDNRIFLKSNFHNKYSSKHTIHNKDPLRIVANGQDRVNGLFNQLSGKYIFYQDEIISVKNDLSLVQFHNFLSVFQKPASKTNDFNFLSPEEPFPLRLQESCCFQMASKPKDGPEKCFYLSMPDQICFLNFLDRASKLKDFTFNESALTQSPSDHQEVSQQQKMVAIANGGEDLEENKGPKIEEDTVSQSTQKPMAKESNLTDLVREFKGHHWMDHFLQSITFEEIKKLGDTNAKSIAKSISKIQEEFFKKNATSNYDFFDKLMVFFSGIVYNNSHCNVLEMARLYLMYFCKVIIKDLYTNPMGDHEKLKKWMSSGGVEELADTLRIKFEKKWTTQQIIGFFKDVKQTVKINLFNTSEFYGPVKTSVTSNQFAVVTTQEAIQHTTFNIYDVLSQLLKIPKINTVKNGEVLEYIHCINGKALDLLVKKINGDLMAVTYDGLNHFLFPKCYKTQPASMDSKRQNHVFFAIEKLFEEKLQGLFEKIKKLSTKDEMIGAVVTPINWGVLLYAIEQNKQSLIESMIWATIKKIIDDYLSDKPLKIKNNKSAKQTMDDYINEIKLIKEKRHHHKKPEADNGNGEKQAEDLESQHQHIDADGNKEIEEILTILKKEISTWDKSSLAQNYIQNTFDQFFKKFSSALDKRPEAKGAITQFVCEFSETFFLSLKSLLSSRCGEIFQAIHQILRNNLEIKSSYDRIFIDCNHNSCCYSGETLVLSAIMTQKNKIPDSDHLKHLKSKMNMEYFINQLIKKHKPISMALEFKYDKKSQSDPFDEGAKPIEAQSMERVAQLISEVVITSGRNNKNKESFHGLTISEIKDSFQQWKKTQSHWATFFEHYLQSQKEYFIELLNQLKAIKDSGKKEKTDENGKDNNVTIVIDGEAVEAPESNLFFHYEGLADHIKLIRADLDSVKDKKKDQHNQLKSIITNLKITDKGIEISQMSKLNFLKLIYELKKKCEIDCQDNCESKQKICSHLENIRRFIIASNGNENLGLPVQTILFLSENCFETTYKKWSNSMVLMNMLFEIFDGRSRSLPEKIKESVKKELVQNNSLLVHGVKIYLDLKQEISCFVNNFIAYGDIYGGGSVNLKSQYEDFVKIQGFINHMITCGPLKEFFDIPKDFYGKALEQMLQKENALLKKRLDNFKDMASFKLDRSTYESSKIQSFKCPENIYSFNIHKKNATISKITINEDFVITRYQLNDRTIGNIDNNNHLIIYKNIPKFYTSKQKGNLNNSLIRLLQEPKRFVENETEIRLIVKESQRMSEQLEKIDFNNQIIDNLLQRTIIDGPRNIIEYGRCMNRIYQKTQSPLLNYATIKLEDLYNKLLNHSTQVIYDKPSFKKNINKFLTDISTEKFKPFRGRFKYKISQKDGQDVHHRVDFQWNLDCLWTFHGNNFQYKNILSKVTYEYRSTIMEFKEYIMLKGPDSDGIEKEKSPVKFQEEADEKIIVQPMIVEEQMAIEEKMKRPIGFKIANPHREVQKFLKQWKDCCLETTQESSNESLCLVWKILHRLTKKSIDYLNSQSQTYWSLIEYKYVDLNNHKDDIFSLLFYPINEYDKKVSGLVNFFSNNNISSFFSINSEIKPFSETLSKTQRKMLLQSMIKPHIDAKETCEITQLLDQFMKNFFRSIDSLLTLHSKQHLKDNIAQIRQQLESFFNLSDYLEELIKNIIIAFWNDSMENMLEISEEELTKGFDLNKTLIGTMAHRLQYMPRNHIKEVVEKKKVEALTINEDMKKQVQKLIKDLYCYMSLLEGANFVILDDLLKHTKTKHILIDTFKQLSTNLMGNQNVEESKFGFKWLNRINALMEIKSSGNDVDLTSDRKNFQIFHALFTKNINTMADSQENSTTIIDNIKELGLDLKPLLESIEGRL
jgi:hypothetical protein